jgi:hypothetical protein
LQLNPDCIRSVLLTIEGLTDGKFPRTYFIWGIPNLNEKFPLLSCFSEEEIRYHVYQCEYTGYFVD